MDREERDIIAGIAFELQGIRLALKDLVAIAGAREKKPEAEPQPASSEMGLDALFVSRRTENCLRKAGCRSVADVARKTATSLSCTRGVGTGVLQEIRTALHRIGLKLAGD